MVANAVFVAITVAFVVAAGFATSGSRSYTDEEKEYLSTVSENKYIKEYMRKHPAKATEKMKEIYRLIKSLPRNDTARADSEEKSFIKEFVGTPSSAITKMQGLYRMIKSFAPIDSTSASTIGLTDEEKEVISSLKNNKYIKAYMQKNPSKATEKMKGIYRFIKSIPRNASDTEENNFIKDFIPTSAISAKMQSLYAAIKSLFPIDLTRPPRDEIQKASIDADDKEPAPDTAPALDSDSNT